MLRTRHIRPRTIPMRCLSKTAGIPCIHTAYLGADVLALEDRGLAMTTTALRVAYAAGGDGEVRQLAKP